MKKIFPLLVALLVLSLACGIFDTAPPPEPDVDQISTLVALTTEAVLTQVVPPTSEPPPPPSPSPVPTLTDEEAIRQALLAKLGWTVAELDFSMGENSGTVARGTVKKVGEMHGAGWFAGKDGAGNWVIAYIGQGVPSCSEIQPFNFPTTWISHCLDGSGNTITR